MPLRPILAAFRRHGPRWLSLACACPVGVLLALVWCVWNGTLLYARALGFWKDAA